MYWHIHTFVCTATYILLSAPPPPSSSIDGTCRTLLLWYHPFGKNCTSDSTQCFVFHSCGTCQTGDLADAVRLRFSIPDPQLSSATCLLLLIYQPDCVPPSWLPTPTWWNARLSHAPGVSSPVLFVWPVGRLTSLFSRYMTDESCP
jgi:hypothetical protein